MKIRDLKEDDIKACLDIYNYYIENTCYTLEEEKLNLDSFAKRVKRIQSHYPFLVYTDEMGFVLGYAYLDGFHERSAYRKTADLSIYVDKDHLHDHIGVILLDEIEKKAKEYGITNIISIVTSENENSLQFHEKHGFLLEGNIHDVAFKLGRSISVYYLRKPILK